jgi:hypothetical protein
MSPINIACPKCAQQPGEPCKWDSANIESLHEIDYAADFNLYHFERIEAQRMADTLVAPVEIPDAVIEAAADEFV